MFVVAVICYAVHRHGWVKLATGSQSLTPDRKSLAGQDERSIEDDEYEEVCHICLPHVHNIDGCVFTLLFPLRWDAVEYFLHRVSQKFQIYCKNLSDD